MTMRISPHLSFILHRAPTTRGGVQLVRYGIVVGCGYVLAVALYSGELAIDIAPYLALGIAFVLNGLFNFAFIRLWAFPPSGRGVRTDLARFRIVAAASAVVNYASFALLYSAIGLHAETSQRLAILIAAPVTFLANRLWSFRTRAESVPQAPATSAPTSARKESYSRM